MNKNNTNNLETITTVIRGNGKAVKSNCFRLALVGTRVYVYNVSVDIRERALHTVQVNCLYHKAKNSTKMVEYARVLIKNARMELYKQL